MKRTRLSLALALMLALVSLLTPALSEALPYAASDLVCNGLAPGATLAQVQAALGEPTSVEEAQTQPATGAQLQTIHYAGLTLVFTDGALSSAEWDSSAYEGPRGLKVGDAEAAIAAAFPYDPAQATDTVLYSAGWVDALSAPLPPCALRTPQENGSTMYTFIAPVTPYSAEMLATPEAYVYETHGWLGFLVNPDQTIVTMAWGVSALSE